MLPDCKNVAFNSAKITSQTSIMAMKVVQNFSGANWEWYPEFPGIWSENVTTDMRCIEQISIAKDETDYLWYTTR